MARRRYVPNTYNNRRFLRIIVGAVTTIALAFVIVFLILFFIFQSYVVDGQLEIPWLTETDYETPVSQETLHPQESPDDFTPGQSDDD